MEALINQCMIAHQYRFKKAYIQALKLNAEKKEAKLTQLNEEIQDSLLLRKQRENNVPAFTYPDLPINAKKDDIIKALHEHQVIVVAGETGSGKTTQLPKLCLEAGLGRGGLIGHTQPRRIAARTVAMRIASELESPLGKYVGFKVRFSDTSSPENYIKIMTDGILLSETQTDKWLTQYDCLIIDEAHERSLNIDFLLGYLKKLTSKRKDLKVIITSATIDVKRFSEFFNHAPVIEVEGRSYPVEVLYLGQHFHDDSDDPIMQVAHAVDLALSKGPGDLLIFQSGEKEIREVIELLSKRRLNQVELLPLFSRQSNQEQQRVFQSAKKRKIIVTTNVAETSLTVPNIRYVIDSGLARISRYNYRNKLQRLPIESISRASADQRKGRCGRVGPGVCFRLYSEEDYNLRPHYTEPEILRTNLAGVILKMLSLNFESIESFPFIEPPDNRYIKDGFTLLERLGAVDDNKRITPLGKMLANIPIEPKLGRVIIAANHYGALTEILIIASALSIVDVRERPQDNQAKADEKHAQFAHENSDFMSYLNLWHFIMSHRAQLSHQKMRKLCHENFLSFLRVLEWIDVHQQLCQIANELNFKVNQVPVDYSLVHKSLLCGFIDGIGVKDEKKEYTGARGIKFFIHPQSSVFKKTPRWMLSSEIVHTSKTYARINGAIETPWIEEVAQSLLKKQYDEPHFDPKSGNVVAFERASLFGLEIYNKKKINYERVAPRDARKIFIEQGLVQEQMLQPFPFYQKNKIKRKEVENLEDRIRKKLILLDESKIAAFYEATIPFYVCSVRALEKYLEKHNQESLCINQQGILLNEIPADLLALYPNTLTIKDQPFELSYHFDLNEPQDGVTLIVPFEMLKYIKDEDFSYLVPGLLEDKIDFLIRALPKRNRTLFVPVPDYVKKALTKISFAKKSLESALQAYLEEISGISLGKDCWQQLQYPSYLMMHFKVINANGEILAKGDNIKQLYQELKEDYLEIYSSTQSIERDKITQWDFQDLPKEYTVKRNNLDYIYYPALVDNQTSLSIKLFDARDQAEFYHRKGLARIFLLTLQESCKNIKRNIPQQIRKDLTKRYEPWGNFDSLCDDVFLCAALFLFVDDEPLIYSHNAFEKKLNKARLEFTTIVNQTLTLLNSVLNAYLIVQAMLSRISQSLDKQLQNDLQAQLSALFTLKFVQETPLVWLKRYPVYLKAMQSRLEKLPRMGEKDKQANREIEGVLKVYTSKLNTKDTSFRSPFHPLIAFRWKIEELRISLFAQELKTIEPVSKVRLLKLLENIE